jgi:hypothetical protein
LCLVAEFLSVGVNADPTNEPGYSTPDQQIMSSLNHKVKKTTDDVAGVAKKASGDVIDGARKIAKKVEKTEKRAR